MQSNPLPVIMAMAAPPSGSQSGTPQSGLFGSPLVFMGLMFVIFYFILIRPQQKRAKEQRKMIEALKSGDKVITSAGIVGEVITVKERTVSLRSADSKLEVTKDSVVAITEPKA
jgi:preprotein translocase subunit YajC